MPYPLSVNNHPEEIYWLYYLKLLQENHFSSSSIGWGHLPNALPGFRAFVKREREVALEYLSSHIDGLICDVSVGAGSYFLEIVKEARLVVALDLDVGAVRGVAYNQARERGLKNLLFVRADYLQMPFSDNVFDAMICIDVLERGFSHEQRVLKEIIRCLKPNGKFVADFHNKRWIQNKRIFEYNKKIFRELLKGISAANVKFIPLGYVPTRIVPYERAYDVLNRFFKLFFSPSRYVILGEKRG